MLWAELYPTDVDALAALFLYGDEYEWVDGELVLLDQANATPEAHDSMTRQYKRWLESLRKPEGTEGTRGAAGRNDKGGDAGEGGAPCEARVSDEAIAKALRRLAKTRCHQHDGRSHVFRAFDLTHCRLARMPDDVRPEWAALARRMALALVALAVPAGKTAEAEETALRQRDLGAKIVRYLDALGVESAEGTDEG
jgi:hypothetical protein